jgi:uncharacterized membrane protein YgdD (TMEM256/DUF423 family)
MLTQTEIKKYSILASIFIATAIGLGAIGAHALEGVPQITPKNIESWKTGVLYQLLQGLGLFAILLIVIQLKILNIKGILVIHILGTVLFSVSIYLLVLNSVWQQVWLKYAMVALTPLGGVLMIVGWLLFVIKLVNLKT